MSTSPCRLALLSLLLTTFPAVAQTSAPALYKIVKEEDRVQRSDRDRNGRLGLFITVQFKIVQIADDKAVTNVGKDEIIVEEDHRRVTDLEIFQPRSPDPLTVVLVLDVSGSMAKDNKLAEAKDAARLFLDTLHEKTDCGLILFDHRILVEEPPIRDPQRHVAHRHVLRKHIDDAKPLGGTAYLDATARAIEMVKSVTGRKAVLLMTDGVDLNSKATLNEVTKLARTARVPVYTLGVGDPGKREAVTTVLVLDHSGSMSAPADDSSKVPKIKALHQAAGQFVQLMRPGARTTLLPFNTTAQTPDRFTADKDLLTKRIQGLKPDGETALFDAIFSAVETLEAAQPQGKRAVVALTDGIDNSSRRRVEEVIERAQESRIPLHLLGLGRPGELDEKVMRGMATATGGEYHHARNENDLVQIFENLSIQLHDDGFDHEVLTQLASATGGKFYHARKASELRLHYQELAEELQTTYTVTLASRRPVHDGTSRGIDISVVRNGVRVSDVTSFDYQVGGVVVAQMHPMIYLGLLVILAGLLVLPAGMRRVFGSSAAP
ncbi:MAG: VWA domain-containing protein [Gemmataceae bacterium]|nr:VWA domain-containing protein [Gemmataceae bacterium]